MNESVARIEAIIGRKVKRDIGQMTECAKGNLARAAEAIMNTPNAHVGIVTGFYIQHAEPPSPETDGLGGMAHLAAGLANAGIPVTVITDTPCAKAVWAVVDALPMPVNLEVVSTTESSVLRLRRYLDRRSADHSLDRNRAGFSGFGWKAPPGARMGHVARNSAAPSSL